MEAGKVINALGALAHHTRLAVFRMLVQRGPGGLPAGVIAETLGLPPSSLTFHLQLLSQAGLVTRRRAGRQLIYATDFRTIESVIAFLTENCCGTGTACAPACLPALAADPHSTERRTA